MLLPVHSPTWNQAELHTNLLVIQCRDHDDLCCRVFLDDGPAGFSGAGSTDEGGESLSGVPAAGAIEGASQAPHRDSAWSDSRQRAGVLLPTLSAVFFSLRPKVWALIGPSGVPACRSRLPKQPCEKPRLSKRA